MPVEEPVLSQRSGVLGKARGEHVRNDSGARRGSQHVIETAQPFFLQTEIHIVEKVVHVLHRRLEVKNSKLEGQDWGGGEALRLHSIPLDWHCCSIGDNRRSLP